MSNDDTKRDGAKPDEAEPSMEDILASIRRILSDDNKDGDEEGAMVEGHPEDPEPEDPNNVVEFAAPPADQPVDELPAAPEPAFNIADENPFEAPLPEPQPVASASNVLDLTPQMRLAAEQQLISSPARDQSTDVLTQLARAILDQRELTVATTQVTLEGMVREMLRPLLREWLDRNLPHLIERLVKQEIDQMVNRAERRDR